MISQKLKQDTLLKHQQLEKLIIHEIKNIKNLSEYNTLLAAFYGFTEPVEQQVSVYLETGFLADYGSRRKASLILQDIASLGFKFSGNFNKQQPEITDVFSAMGAQYVLEGSTLGGQIIKKMLQQKLQIPDESGFAYFTGYGVETHDYWARFIEKINSIPMTAQEEEAVIWGANDTFDKFRQYITRLYNELPEANA